MKNTKLRSPMNSIRCLLRPRGKHAFLRQLPAHARILDVGCGNNSPFVVKTILPLCHYTGVDIGDHNQTKPNVADEYLLTSPEDFARRISLFVACFDAVISAHNLEPPLSLAEQGHAGNMGAVWIRVHRVGAQGPSTGNRGGDQASLSSRATANRFVSTSSSRRTSACSRRAANSLTLVDT